MKVHAFQHVPFEGLGEIAPWLRDNGHRVTHTEFFHYDALPDPDDVDWLIVMGGPMNVYEYRSHPWLRVEKRFIEQILAQDKCVLGICLGAQLIADVLGAKVYQNQEKEIGRFPITWRPAAEPFVGSTEPSRDAFHWHGDTFDLPAGATLLAESAGCRHQAFNHGPRVVGLQFHLEMNDSGVIDLVQNCRHDLTTGRFVRSEAEILSPPGLAWTTELHHLLRVLESRSLSSRPPGVSAPRFR